MNRLSMAVGDSLVLAQRNLIRIVRAPDLLTAFTVQPIMFVLLFVYVFGGAIAVPPAYDNYADFLIPGIVIQNIAFGGFATALGLADDLNRGLIDRFRSLPMARAAVLAGRTIADIATNLLSLVIVVVVGLIVGFSFDTSFASIMLGFVLVVMIGYAFSWVFAYIGLVLVVARGGERVRLHGDLPADVHLLGLRAARDDARSARGVRRGEPVHDLRGRAPRALGGNARGHRRVGRVRLDDRDHDRVRADLDREVPPHGRQVILPLMVREGSRGTATALVLGGIVSVQVGAAFATTLFDELGPGGTVFLRIAFAAVLLLVIWRPPLRLGEGAARRDVRRCSGWSWRG